MATAQTNIFQEANKKFCIDACAILDFWGSVDYPRPYDVEVKEFRKLWDHIATQIDEGCIILPYPIYEQVAVTTKPELKRWLDARKALFPNYEDAESELAEIVNKFDIYTTTKASLEDAILVAVAKQKSIAVITSERKSNPTNYQNPKIPNVCDAVTVKWKSLPEYFKLVGL